MPPCRPSPTRGRKPFLTPEQEKQALGWLADPPTKYGFPTVLWTAQRVADQAEGPREWLAAVERYIDRHYADRVRYFHWLRHFVGMATVSRHLDAYVQSFLAIDRF